MTHEWGWKPDRDFLYQAYVVEQRSILSIARELHCRNGNLMNAIRDYGFTRPRVTKKWLLDHYFMRRESLKSIASQLGISEGAVRYYFRRYKLPQRNGRIGTARVPELNDFDWLYEHYITQNLSQGRIAALLGCHEGSVSRACCRLGIPRKGRDWFMRAVKRRGRTSFTLKQRRGILERDHYCCQMPGCQVTSEMSRFAIHHIVPRKHGGRNHLINGITLCESCHLLTYCKEEEFASLFHSIVATHSQEPPT